MNPDRGIIRSTSDVSFLDRTFRSRSLRRHASESDSEAFGPTGLTTVHNPSSETLVEIIFVHGLRGGSRQAWSYSPHIMHFWPKEWLPEHPDFEHARIHTYGYPSDWMLRRENPSSIHDFGLGLLEAMLNNPDLRQDKITKIILVAHSMGGLVIKKSIITARHNPMFQGLCDRFHAAFFFGTPHRGSDLALTLSKYLRATMNTPKPFVTDLLRGSDTTNLLNEEFRHVYEGMSLYSFVETVPMTWHVGSGLIVERDSAVMGLPGEHIITIEANHRYMNKFVSPQDSEYKKVRDSLATVVQDVVQRAPMNHILKNREELSILKNYLNITYDPEDELIELCERRLESSCEWLITGESFQRWLFDDMAPRYLWLRGPPATGKSVLTASITEQISPRNRSYFFFRQGDHRSTLSNLFQSIAYQMATKNRAIRDELLEIARDNFQLPEDDYKAVWKKIFTNGIFLKWPASTQYWVIDALDECGNTGPRMRQTLGALFSKIESILRLKICISSRPTIDTGQLFDSLQTTTVHVNHESNADDIRRYVEDSRSLLPVKDEETRKELVEKIIERACGCFLWVKLVIAKLEDCYFSEEIEAALENVPNELDQIYSENLEAMSSDLRSGKPIPPKSRLAKTILTWTICATRPLSVEELKSAIKIEFESDVIRDLGASIASLCGNLVYVDKHGLVQIVHQTARAFLTDDGLESYFRIKPGEGHMQLATACLKCLCSEEMKFQRRHRRSTASPRGVARSPISQYAIRAFTEHLARAESSSDTLFRQLTTFLKTNVLVWIEELAYTRDLTRLISAATHFKSYLARRSKHAPPLEDDIRMWSRDLPRIVTEFGRNLLDHPLGIHRLIPPFCPRSSIIHSQFGSQLSGIQLIGLTNTHWDDRICCHYYKDQMTKSIACQDQRYAVGLANGVIRVYDTSTCEQAMELDHGEPVRSLVFGPVAKTLASSGYKNVVVWDLTTQSQHLRISLESTPLAVSFNEIEPFVNVAACSTEISVWDFLSKSKVSSRFPRSPPETADHLRFERVPTTIEISTESNMIAVYYRSRPLLIYDLQSLDLLGACQNVAAGSSSQITHTPITSIVFNPRPEMQRLAVAYWDGDIALFDTDSFRLVCYTRSESQTLTASADGRTLAGGNSGGRIEIFDFGTLEKIYSAVPSSDGVTSMAFTSDSRRLLDIRAYQVNVWEPFVLTRNFVDDNSSEPSDSIGIAMEDLHISRYDDSDAIITAVICCYDGTRAICGKSNGAVDMYDVTNEHKSCWHLYKSSAMEVSVLEWNEQHRLVASGDMSGRFQVMRLSADSTQRTGATKLIIKKQLEQGESINQLLISASGMQILVSSSQADQVWCLTTGRLLKRYSYAIRTSWKWFLHPSDPAGVIKLQDAYVQRYQWEQFQPLSGLVQIRDNSDATATIDIEHAILIKYNGIVALKVLIYKDEGSGTNSHNIKHARLYTITLPTLEYGHESLAVTSIFQDLLVSTKADIDLLIGTVITVLGGHILIFISNKGWVCSVDLNIPFPHDLFQRHFFVPFAWLSSSDRLLIKVSDRGDVLFVRGQEIAVVRNGFEELDVVQLGVGTETKRASADDSTSGLKPSGTSFLAGWNWSTA